MGDFHLYTHSKIVLEMWEAGDKEGVRQLMKEWAKSENGRDYSDDFNLDDDNVLNQLIEGLKIEFENEEIDELDPAEDLHTCDAHLPEMWDKGDKEGVNNLAQIWFDRIKKSLMKHPAHQPIVVNFSDINIETLVENTRKNGIFKAIFYCLRAYEASA
jgi:hypothetical protein